MTSDMTTNSYTFYQNQKSKEVHRCVYSGGDFGSKAQVFYPECARSAHDLKEISDGEALAAPQEERCGHCWPSDGGGSDATGGVEETATDTEGEIA